MYIRFVVAEIDKNSRRELGVLHAANNLRTAGRLYAHEEHLHDTVQQWFNEHLARPIRFTASRSPFNHKQKKAISWFKDNAHLHLAKIRELDALLRNHDIPVLMLTTQRVGYVVYEDKFQIVAEPFADGCY